MSAFFQGQMDYIFFFYGLAFIGLGVVSYILTNELNQRLAWGWLALFGFTHGANEWLDLAALCWGDGMWFGALRWALMTVSFFCLVEFGRLSMIKRGNRGPARWIYLLLALGAGLGGLWGFSGLNATTRYFLGLVGSLWAGWALYAEGREADTRCRPWLLAGSIGFILYGLATGAVVSRAGFWPATVMNYDTFTGFTGLPVQLLRGLLAMWIALMITGYFRVAWPADYERCHRYRAHYLYGAGAALAVILAGGWFLTQFLGNLAWQQVRENSQAHNKITIQRLTFEIREAEEAVKAMSGSPWIVPVLESKSPRTLAQANSVLDRYQQRFGASVAYLLDRSGDTIAASNRDDPDSFVGQNYAFRPYFQEAMAGHVGRYFALGATSKKRGCYTSHPVKDAAGNILGVAVFKITLNRFQQDLQPFDPAFLIDPQGIVLVASRSDLDYHSLWPMTATSSSALKTQYGTDSFTPIFAEPLLDATRVEFAGRSYAVTRENIDNVAAPGWTLVNLEPVYAVVYYRLMGIVAAFVMVFLTLVFAGTNLSIREGANRIMASEARFRAMFAAAPEAVFVFDPETRKILGANPFMAQWLGYGPEELAGLAIDQVRVTDPEEAQTECPWPNPGGLPQSSGPRYRKKDGSLVDVECTTANIFHGDHIRELVFVRDITERKRAEVQLENERDFISTLLDTVGALVVVLNPQGHIIRFNRTCEQVSGYSFQEVEGRLVWDFLIPPEDVEAVQKVFYTLQTGAAPEEQENYWVSRDGERRLIAWSNTSLKDAGGEVTHVIGTGIDVTARRRAEDDLRQAKEYLENILDNSADPIGIVDRRGRIIKWNKACERVFGYSLDELAGKASFELYADKIELQAMMVDLRRNGSIRGHEIHMKKKDGGVALFALSINLLYDHEQKVIGSVCVARDLSEIKKTLDDLAIVNQRLQHEVNERTQMEDALQKTNRRLEGVVAQVEERNRTMTLANEMADTFQACQASEEAYETISHFMPRFFPNDAGSLYLLNNSRNLYEVVAQWGKNPPANIVFAPDECWSVRRGRLHRVEKPQATLPCRHVAHPTAGGYLCVPLIAQGETLGVLHLQLGPPAHDLTAEMAAVRDQLALTLAEDMAMALANLRLRETLRSQAIRDPLTGLFNRRYLEETMERELNRVKRQGTSLGVIMMDLDHFKQYNDTFGHSAGDELLNALGTILKGHIRGEDIACRYGGEEFLLIMPGISLEVALARAENLRQAVKEMHRQRQGLKPTTLSLGVAIYPHHGDTGLQLIQAADIALYRAKQAGRDRVMVAIDPETTILTASPAPALRQMKSSQA
jgi:diguanylate cyclase (GGDEF)-like protein/PAS domain S-box-containing protein